MPDQDLHRLTQDEDSSVRRRAAEALGDTFSHVPDKALAWQDLIRLTQDQNGDVRYRAAEALGQAFSHVPDKPEAQQDLHRLVVKDPDYGVLLKVVDALAANFQHIPDKETAWKDLVLMTSYSNFLLQCKAADALIVVHQYVLDKETISRDLHQLTRDPSSCVRSNAANALGAAFQHFSDKETAWADLISLACDENLNTRRMADGALGKAFQYTHNKEKAWTDLVKRAGDVNINTMCRYDVDDALGMAFQYVPDKEKALMDLHRLAQDRNSEVRIFAALALSSSYSHIIDKDQAWQDLHRLTQDKDSNVREYVAEALGQAFSHVPNKHEAWQDLLRLTQDQDSNVREYAYHSLGRASVFKATESDDRDTMKKELETAVVFFEKSSQENVYGPARFCCPFYRSYFAIIFQEAKEDEVQRYLADAKEAVGGSKSKDELLKAVENLARALQKAQRLKNRPSSEIADELNAYRWYCDKASEHMATAEDKAPGAVKLMKKCNPFLEEQILATIVEIQEKAKQICQITHGSGTEYEAPGTEVYRAAKVLSSGDLVSNETSSSIIVLQLTKFCEFLPNDEKDPVCNVVKEINLVSEYPEKLQKIALALSNLGPVLLNLLKGQQCLEDVVILTVLPEEYNAICIQLSSFNLLDLPPNMGTNSNIYAWKSGHIPCRTYNSTYKVTVGMIGRAGNSQSALAAKEAISLWRPHYLIFSGIAGGLPASGLKKGDVIIADCIYGYEYGKLVGEFKPRGNLIQSISSMIRRMLGKLEVEFKPRGNWTYKTDPGLLNGAVAYSLQDKWRYHIKSESPEECRPKVSSCEIASGEKVVEDPTREFFTQVLKMWPKVKAVEMEGAGIGSAIEQAQSLKIPVGFMVIRAISDLPRHEGEGDKTRGTEERDAWKAYASDAAAAFTIRWIADGLPLPPST